MVQDKLSKKYLQKFSRCAIMDIINSNRPQNKAKWNPGSKTLSVHYLGRNKNKIYPVIEEPFIKNSGAYCGANKNTIK